jgi:hypothetical protein
VSICFTIYILLSMHKTKSMPTASSGTYQVEWFQWVTGVQQKEWLAAGWLVADAERPWNEDQVAMADVVQGHEIQNEMLTWILGLQLTPPNVSVSPKDVVQESHVEDFQATSPVACHIQVLTVLCYKQ